MNLLTLIIGTQQIMPNEGNVLSFKPPGLNQVLHIKYPDCRLAVCEKCKKNYKTRDMCRVRNKHRDPPWSTAYICITLDESCTGSNNKLVDGHFNVKLDKAKPFCIKKNFDSKTPVCTTCKKTNRTRSFCRERHKHKLLPWCTVYVVLSAEVANFKGSDMETKEKNHKEEKTSSKSENVTLPNNGEDELISANNDKFKSKEAGISNSSANSPNELTIKSYSNEEYSNGETKKNREKNDDDGKIEQNMSDVTSKNVNELTNMTTPQTKDIKFDQFERGKTSDINDSPMKVDENEKDITTNHESDNINDVDESRTFLAQVSCNCISMQWLDEAEDDLTLCSTQQFSNARAIASSNHSPMFFGTIPTLNYPYYSPFPMNEIAHRQALHMQNQQLLQQQAQFAAHQQAAFRAQYNHQMQMAIANGQQGFVPNMTTVSSVPGIPIASPNASSRQEPKLNVFSQSDNAIANNEQNNSSKHSQMQEQQWHAQFMYQQQMLNQQLCMQHQRLMKKPGDVSNLLNLKQQAQSDALSQLNQTLPIAKLSESHSPQILQQSNISSDLETQPVIMNEPKEATIQENEKRKKNDIQDVCEEDDPSNKSTEQNKKKKKE